ncbi:PREDICTED: uncharacterized protein LOC105527412 [Colobus angolensis palliatus]|uniref:uncharacterized protein LOC105527412 n=1 Tax=Colobus angolensis palliatus TaxID=336983 RepID=UPI0005F4636D|nr:PREDICTED: uncharacterized protein LOC105527412 [Colobus angolensis palliatus]
MSKMNPQWGFSYHCGSGTQGERGPRRGFKVRRAGKLHIGKELEKCEEKNFYSKLEEIWIFVHFDIIFLKSTSGVPSPVLQAAKDCDLLGEGGIEGKRCVRARAFISGACTPLGSLKVGDTLSVLAAACRTRCCQPRTREGGSPQPRRGTWDPVQYLAQSVPKQGQPSGSWAPQRWTPISSEWAAGARLARAPEPSRRLSAPRSWGAGGALPGRKQAQNLAPGERQLVLARTPDSSQMETVSAGEPAGIPSGLALQLCPLTHFTKAAFTALRQI